MKTTLNCCDDTWSPAPLPDTQASCICTLRNGVGRMGDSVHTCASIPELPASLLSLVVLILLTSPMVRRKASAAQGVPH